MSERFGLHPSSLGTEPIAAFTGHLVEFARRTDPTIPIFTALPWTLSDLVRHLAEVQDFWAWIIENRPAAADGVVRRSTESIDDLEAANRRLVNALNSARLDDAAWSWHPDHQTVEFTWRRQSHEALVHCFDAVLAQAGAEWPPVDPMLAADGLDELFSVMIGGNPSWAEVTRGGDWLLVETTDTDDAWLLNFATLSGTSPGGTTYSDEPLVVPAEPGFTDPGARISGTALDLDLWGWGRGGAVPIQVEGDVHLMDRLRALVAESTQ